MREALVIPLSPGEGAQKEGRRSLQTRDEEYSGPFDLRLAVPMDYSNSTRRMRSSVAWRHKQLKRLARIWQGCQDSDGFGRCFHSLHV
jgi:hypothetical protein